MRTISCCVAGLCMAVASLLAPARSAAAGEGLKIEYERSEETNLLTLTIHGTAGPDEIVLSCKEGLVAVDGKAIEKTNTGQTMPCGAAYGTAPIPVPRRSRSTAKPATTESTSPPRPKRPGSRSWRAIRARSNCGSSEAREPTPRSAAPKASASTRPKKKLRVAATGSKERVGATRSPARAKRPRGELAYVLLA